MNKLTQLRQAVNKAQLDVAYLSDPMTIKYLTGFGSDPIERVLRCWSLLITILSCLPQHLK